MHHNKQQRGLQQQLTDAEARIKTILVQQAQQKAHRTKPRR